MKLLAVDTATSSLSVAIMDAGRLRTELTCSTGQTHARHLMTLVDTALNVSDLSAKDLDAFAVPIGGLTEKALGTLRAGIHAIGLP